MPSILLSYLAFIGMALPDSLLGIAWPSMCLSLGQPVGALGLLVPFGVGSSLLSSAVAGFLLPRAGTGRMLAAGTALSAVALVGFGLAPSFWVLIVAIVVSAAGFGAIDFGLNAHATHRLGARHINWLHASYGLGATAGPILFTAVIATGRSWRWSYLCVAAVQALLAVAFAGAARAWPTPAVHTAPAVPAAPAHTAAAGPATPAMPAAELAGAGSTLGATPTGADPDPSTPPAPRVGRSPWQALRLGALWHGAAVFALQTGVESTTTLWAYLFLTDGRGLPGRLAAGTISAYWAALCVARLVLGPLAERHGSRRILAAGVVGIVLGAALVALPAPTPVAVAGIVLIAVSAAPMFPLLTLTTAERVGRAYADRAIGVQVGASALGAATLPAAVGVLIGNFGALALGPALVALALANAATYATARRRA